MEQIIKPAIVAHCDWSKDAKKRWMAVAVRDDDRWVIDLPEPVGDTADMFDRLRGRSTDQGSLFAGFDFPIGLPEEYGRATGFSDFRAALQGFGGEGWEDWFEVCDSADEISIARPFYPMRPGGRKKDHLLQGLGFTSGDQLLRGCEKKTAERQAACSLFWTLGGNQVGKGAIAGWQEVLRPHMDQIGLWPFDGTLDQLLPSCPVVVAETYPGDVYGQICIPRYPAWSKRKQSGRASVAAPVLEWLDRRGHGLVEGLRHEIRSGFSQGSVGEDQFDATIGLFGMLDVVDGMRSEANLANPGVRTWEGWILGQS